MQIGNKQQRVSGCINKGLLRLVCEYVATCNRKLDCELLGKILNFCIDNLPHCIFTAD